MNMLLQEAGEPAPEVQEEAGFVSSAGSGSWWEGEIVVPGVTHYVPKKDEDVTPLRPKVQEARRRLRKVRTETPEKEYRSLHGKLNAVTQSIGRLEAQVERAIKARAREDAIEKVVGRYRSLAENMAAIELQIAAHEAEMHRKRLMIEDEEFLNLIMEML
jgi:SMC interacting uncharacterized protein involved in chromosome segregation